MKKTILALAVALCAVLGGKAATGDMSVAGAFHYASHYNQAGLGAKFSYEFYNHFCIEPEYIYYFKNDDHTGYSLNFNLKYIIPTSIGMDIYPFIGYSYSHWTEDLGGNYKYDTNKSGANIGCGAGYGINDHFSFFVEQRFHIVSDHNQSVTSFGVRYNF